MFSDNLYGNDFSDLNNYLIKCNAFEDPQHAKLIYLERVFKSKTDEGFDSALEK